MSEQEDALAQQKAQCPFCKIASGEIPSTSIYKDDKVMAVMDINPSVPGHILLLPKDHHPILPLVPKGTFDHMFAVVRDISRAVKKGMVSRGTTVFIANGGAAGQQSAHFLLHIFPRDPGDALASVFTCKEDEQAKQKHAELLEPLRHNLKIMLSKVDLPAGKEAPQQPATAPPKPVEVSPEQKKALAAFIESNTEFREAMINDLEKAKHMIAHDQQLQQLTKGVELDKLHERLRSVYNE